jgi:hypothetical protein
MRLRGALLWEADGEPRRDEIVISDERPNGSGSRIVILDRAGQPRAVSPGELPEGSMLLLPPDASDRDVGRIQRSGYPIHRVADPAVDTEARADEDVDDLAETPADRKARRAAIKAAEAELEEVTARLKRVLRQRHPELFDARGRLRRRAYARVIRERTGDRKYLSREEFIELTGGVLAPVDDPSSADAPQASGLRRQTRRVPLRVLPGA